MKRSSTASGAASLMLVFAASRVLGLLRDRAIGGAFGSGVVTGAFVSAYLIPDVLYLLLAGGALSAAFVPLFTAHLVKGDSGRASLLANSVLNLLVLTSAAVCVLAAAAAPLLVRVAAPGYVSTPDADFELSVRLTRIMMPMLLFTVVAALLAGILNSCEHFLAPALGWCLFNVVIIAMTVSLGRTLGIYAPAFGVLAGAVMLCAAQIPALAAAGFRYRPVLVVADPDVRTFVRSAAVSTVGLTVGQLNILFLPCILASFFGGDAVTNVRFASRLMALPLGVFAVAVATAAFPALARQHASEDREQFRDGLTSALNALIVICVPVSAVLLTTGEPIVRLLYGTGRFDETAVRGTAFALWFYSLGIPAFAAVQLLERGYFARRDVLTPTLFAAAAVCVTIFGGLALAKTRLGYAGPCLACSLSGLVNLALAYEVLRRRMGGLRTGRVVSCAVKCLAAAVPAGAAAYFCANALAPVLSAEPARLPWHSLMSGSNDQPAVLATAIQVAAACAAGFAVYGAAALALRVREAGVAFDRLSLVFRRSP